jgi:hypothetical protein
MTRVLVCLFGFLTVLEFGNLAVGEEPALVPASSLALPCDGLTGGPCDFRPKSDAYMASCFPANCCCDDYDPHPLPRSCFPAYPPWYQCVPAGDVTCCAKACQNNDQRSWWFIPTWRTLQEALWLEP